MPYGVNGGMQNQRSNLVDAYKKNELDQDSGIGIFSLSAMIVDRAEPSEALKSTVIWSTGIEVDNYLLSSKQLSEFCKGKEISSEIDVRASRGAYFINVKKKLADSESIKWIIAGDINQSIVDIEKLKKELKEEDKLIQLIAKEIEEDTLSLKQLVGLADGLQTTGDQLSTGRHFTNVLFNIMRGGIFEDVYQINAEDFISHVKNSNQDVFLKNADFLNSLDDQLTYQELVQSIDQQADLNLQRLAYEYLPLTFSRRHGDPSRPWNIFNIAARNKDGANPKSYEGNWRDIFQNWEALAYSFPDFIEAMITKFVNASTIDGYNPYRITSDGIDWEVIEPDDPWSYIGYWGDHQIVYLLKLLEVSNAHHPDKLVDFLTRKINAYANVPYRIKSYKDTLLDPRDTIDFDDETQHITEERSSEIGSDGKLIFESNGQILNANLTEKILVTVLTKLYNFIPEGGIWLNTQRPEWNDANNALVGNGVSMVTLYYLRRFMDFSISLFGKLGSEKIAVNGPVSELLYQVEGIFQKRVSMLDGSFSDTERKLMIDDLGITGENYRNKAYQGFDGEQSEITSENIVSFFQLVTKFLDHTIRSNKREDGLYHAYNLISFDDDKAEVSYLNEMLEGQVAILSAKVLPANEAVEVLDALKASKIYREDQYSYMLYPDKNLPLFINRNNIEDGFLQKSELARTLLDKKNTDIFEVDINGKIHFNGSFNNANSLRSALEALSENGYSSLVKKESDLLLELFEKTFNHKAFTGRSGTFYGYEGLGSIYWHMVSKLLCAAQENIYLGAERGMSDEAFGNLVGHYYEIRAGIGANKSPDLYGAFPTDAYSHTPGNAGVKQPGMTGQVKEDVINRWAELGVIVNNGCISFNPIFLRKAEFLKQDAKFEFRDVIGEAKKIDITSNNFCFTYCGVPIIYTYAEDEHLEIQDASHQTVEIKGNTMDSDLSNDVFSRSGKVTLIKVFTPKALD
jgi:hypothetical protein